MVKISWKAYMKITYKTDHMKVGADCMLLSIDFENELLNLVPFDDIHQENEFTANLRHCELYKRPPFEVVNDDKELIIKKKIIQ